MIFQSAERFSQILQEVEHRVQGEVKGVAEEDRMPLARLKLRLTTLITVSILYGIATGVNFEENQSGSEPRDSPL